MVKRTLSQLAVAALAVGLAACGNNDTPSSPNAPTPKVGDASGTTIATQASVPPAPADRDSPPGQTPATHVGQPQPEAPPAPTARDTAATQPMADLDKGKETHSLPMSGQVNNHSTPAIDQPNKTTPQGEGQTATQ